jgi:signal transduction histidine kinase/CheY-like chemotaxis protein
VAERARQQQALREVNERLQGQLARLDLLQRITQAIGDRHDLPSIHQVVVHRVEQDLPVDFAGIWSGEPGVEGVPTICLGSKARAAVPAFSAGRDPGPAIDWPRLASWLDGKLVYLADLQTPSQQDLPIPAIPGLRSVVIVPLLTDGKLRGAMLVARQEPHDFTSGDCEFLRQLGEHVALAAHQSALRVSLQNAYDDLQRTQRAMVQQERLRALGPMASGLAHDINNAVSPISLYAGLMLEGGVTSRPKVEEYLRVIQRAADGVGQTVARMRAFYRPRDEEGEHTILDLNALVSEVIELTRVRWEAMPQERGIVVSLDQKLGSGLPPVRGAGQDIRDAITNLIFNAVDAMPEGGTLTIQTTGLAGRDARSDLEGVVLEVRDTGTGMDTATRARCVEPFFSTKGERGTGLGLAMVYGMAHRHGADLEIDSAPGRGTAVRIAFPRGRADATAPSPSVPASLEPMRILLVDDDPLVIRALEAALEVDGHTITTAEGGQAAIEAFTDALEAGHAYQAVITDLGMPFVDGRQVAAAIKVRSQHTPVILLTGWGRQNAPNGESNSNIDHMLSKPPKITEIRKALATCSRVRESR